jgi:ferrochelatase
VKTGVLLMTYGSPASTGFADVSSYLTKVRGGRAPEPPTVQEFQRRYRAIGGSPLIPITQKLARAVEQTLGGEYVVRAAMRFSEPTIELVTRELAQRGAERLVGIVLSPQFSETLMGGYAKTLEPAAKEMELPWSIAPAWHLAPGFVAALASRLSKVLADHGEVPVVFTAHSMPRTVLEREADYFQQLKDTATAVADACGLSADRWYFAYQSAGHGQVDWLKPDLLEVLPELRSAGHQKVIVAPVQFVADHLETLFDIDIAAKEQGQAAGLEVIRVPGLNADHDFATLLARLAEAAVSRSLVASA